MFGTKKEWFMKLNTIIKLLDGRIGTICYNNLDGVGGVWGEHNFTMPRGSFGDELPEPDFMLRDKSLEGRVGCKTAECVGDEFEIINKE
jgi:hypothetical protein